MDVPDSELADIAAELDIDVSELQSDAVKECAESVFEDNPDMTKSQAFAVCQDMENEGQLSEPAHVALAEQRNPGDIERVEESDGTVRYRNIELLAPGVWGDAASQRQFLYSERTTETLADNIVETTVNLFHEQENETTEVGDLDKSSVYVGDADGGLFGDIVLSMDNAASQFADEALQDALATEGEKGLKGPSVEIARPDHQFNAEAGVPEVVDGVITGVGLVGLGVSLGPGSKDVAFDKQTANRAVALAADGDPDILLRYDDMTETNRLLAALSEELSPEELREVASERGIELQIDGEAGMAMDLIEQAMNEGFDPGDQSVDELMTFIAENLDPSEDAMAALEGMAEATVDAEDADSMDALSAEDLMDYIRDTAGDDEGGDEGDEEADDEPNEGDDMGGGEDDEDGMEMQEELRTVKEQVQANAERIEALAEATETLQQDGIDLGDMNEKLDTLAERVESVASNLKDPTSLADAGGPDTGQDADEGTTFVDFGSNQATTKEY